MTALYRIKPLVWGDAKDGGSSVCRCGIFCFKVSEFVNSDGDDSFIWNLYTEDGHWIESGFADDQYNLEDTKEAAEQHWQSEAGIGRFLEPVHNKCSCGRELHVHSACPVCDSVFEWRQGG